ncbi:MAG: PadR family transcriptional regulator [Thermoproteota archaeon]
MHKFEHIPPHPRGILKVTVLELVSESPKKGSEIMDEIEKRTHGTWRPSPGSIYPLLAYLEKQGYIQQKEIEGEKKYVITERGATLLNEAKENLRKERVFEKFSFLFPLSIDFCNTKEPLYLSYKNLWNIAARIICLKREKKLPEETEKKTIEILTDASKKLEELLKENEKCQ